MYLTVRDQNIIRLPRRTSSLRCPPLEVSKARTSPLKIAKTRAPATMATSDIYNSHTNTSTAITNGLTDTIIPIHHPQRRASVRRVVTKAFSTKNKKKRVASSGEHVYTHGVEPAHLPLRITDTSHRPSKLPTSDFPPLRDSAICMATELWDDIFTPQAPPGFLNPEHSTPFLSQRKYVEQHDSDGYSNNVFSPIRKEESSGHNREDYPSQTSAISNTSIHFVPPTFAVSNRKNPGILCVILIVKPKVIKAELFSEETIWVAIQIRGEISYGDSTVEPITSYDSHLTEPDLVENDDIGPQSTGAVKSEKTRYAVDSSPCLPDLCCTHCPNSLESVTAHRTTSLGLGVVSGISISFQPRPDGVIKDVLGSTEYSGLLPGQTISLMVRVKLTSLAALLPHQYSLNSPTQSISDSINEAISDLEMTLGEHLSELFDVQVRYTHSLFPHNTRLLVQETCWLRQILSPPSPFRGLLATGSPIQDHFNEIERSCRPSSDSPATVVHRRTEGRPDEEDEIARKIWQQIRKTSRPDNQPVSEHDEETVRVHIDPHIQEVRKTVQKNQRKMSVDTLRSLARDIRHVSGDSKEFKGNVRSSLSACVRGLEL
jgi:hypothetical protein